MQIVSLTGINCETCEDYYYRPEHLSQNDSTPCQPCQCELSGAVTNPLTGLQGDCVINNHVTTPTQLNNQLQNMVSAKRIVCVGWKNFIDKHSSMLPISARRL